MTSDLSAPEIPGWPVMSLGQANALLTAPGSPFEIETVQIDGRPVKWWKNGPRTLRDTFLIARLHAARTFLVYEEDRVTYDAFMRASLALAEVFIEQGVKPGDRVAVVMRNLPEWPVTFFAGVLTGAIVAPLNAWWSGAELVYGLKDCGAVIAVVDDERLKLLAPLLDQMPALRRVYACRQSGPAADDRIVSLESVIGRPGDWAALPEGRLPDVELTPETPAVLFYTSGTSGQPKGALGTHRNSGCGLVASQFSVVRSVLRRGDPPPSPDPDAPQGAGLVSIPFFHTTGCNAFLLVALATGQKLVCQRRFDAEEALALIEREQITSVGGVPAIAITLMTHPNRDKYDLSSLQLVSYGGAAAPTELVRRIVSGTVAAPGSGWGMTETSATHTHHVAEDYIHRPNSCGPALPVGEVKVVDEAGNTLPTGEAGELMAYGPNIVKGYWNRPKETAETFVDGWVRTGDIACIDEEGFVFIVDRKKDIIIRGGENIYCQEVEDILYEHPAVEEAALVARAHPVLGEEAVAFVTLIAGEAATAEELRAFVAARLAGFKVPAEIRSLAQRLPRNAAGKIVKPDLKALLAAETAA
ncbi:MAG: acyl--CoA ligase [Alphaproteobacteria bacterium]|uniref:class I adenylate-forming enzyme family protein n=1 Tax=Brevundimonas sp. TaxID=1871086 RepID=UPI00120802EA|nr:acyl--CoA ligase [Alphaproteobacteria bacterium]MBU2163100.1 acyl--CoA ligase [Alphaproteobacteria bacterium]MBU2231749.1 acyl--CoA ligase [Alphaproteobacteria bacterium]TAJ43289.1 MAG: long-chain fatty acid--CoA ligase [Brevundimonas sp.]